MQVVGVVGSAEKVDFLQSRFPQAAVLDDDDDDGGGCQ